MFKYNLRLNISLLSVAKEVEELSLKHLDGYPGVSDKVWNMVSLSPSLGDAWWEKSYFAFKCTKILLSKKEGKSLVELRFHWLPTTLKHWQRDGRPVEQYEEYIGSRITNSLSPRSGVSAFRFGIPRPIRSGDHFDIPCPTADVQKMKMAFDIRWSLSCIVALAGAAEVTMTTMMTRPDDTSRTGWEGSRCRRPSQANLVESKLNCVSTSVQLNTYNYRKSLKYMDGPKQWPYNKLHGPYYPA